MTNIYEQDSLPRATTPCAWCFDPSAETIEVVIGEDGPEHELDLCARHLSELLNDSRPAS